MKARIKATGEVINIEINKSAGGNQLYIGRSNWDGVEYTFLGDEIEPINESINESIKCDWRHYRIQAAIVAMHAELSNPNNKFMMCEDKKAIIVERSVGYADALTAKLKRKTR